MASGLLSRSSKARCERKLSHATAVGTLQEQVMQIKKVKWQPSGKRWPTTPQYQPQPASHMAAGCCSERGKKGKQCADGVWKVSKTQVHKRGCIWSAQNTSLGIQWLLYKSWLSLLCIGSDGSAKRLWDLWQHTKSFPDPTGPIVTCCITALQPMQRGLGVENSSLNLGMWEFTHHYLAVCTNALQKITIFKLC